MATNLRRYRSGNRLYRRRLIHGLGFTPYEIETYGLLRQYVNASDFVSWRAFRRQIRPVLNPEPLRLLVDNKWVFYRMVSANGIPIPETYALYDRAYGVTWSGEPCRTPMEAVRAIAGGSASSLVVKPAGGMEGEDITILHDLDHQTGTARSHSGDPVDLLSTVKGLSQNPHRKQELVGGYILQEYVKQHSFLRRLNPDTANTVRVVTYLDTDDQIHLVSAFLRLGRAGSLVDTWNQGGVLVAIDVDSGFLGQGVLKPEFGGDRVSSHPDSGEEFTGQGFPRWDELVDLSHRLAGSLPGLRLIGWDILMTDLGPVVLEGNDNWHPMGVQIHTGGLMSDQSLRDDFARAGFEWPSKVPSAFRVGRQVARRKLTRLFSLADG